MFVFEIFCEFVILKICFGFLNLYLVILKFKKFVKYKFNNKIKKKLDMSFFFILNFDKRKLVKFLKINIKY